MSARGPAVLIILLFMLGIGLIAHRHLQYDVPLLPGDSQTVWLVEARIDFVAQGEPVRVDMARPTRQTALVPLQETGASPGYGLNFIDQPYSRAVWTIREADGPQTLFYRSEVLVSPTQGNEPVPAPQMKQPQWPTPYASAIDDLLQQAQKTSADNLSLTRELLKLFAAEQPQQHVVLLNNRYNDNLPQLLVDMLHSAKVPAAVVYALELQDGRRNQVLLPMLKVWQGGDSQLFFLPGQEPVVTEPGQLLVWNPDGRPLLDVMGAQHSAVRFSMIRQQESAYGALSMQLSGHYDLFNFSIHALPIEEQAVFKTILLLPIGALIVCILRILVGLRTSGTFMPVLIALAFMQTSLWTGLIGFILVVAAGLLVRSYLSSLNLLLVARITAVIISVIAIVGLFSVVAYKFGLTEGLKITLFPMIILSWTIERMSILWEEEGPREVMVQGGGSLLTAVLAYLAMSHPWVQHLTFNFLGLQFVVLALVLMIGSYSGYRLLELRRFREFAH
ncbi:gonadoliberin III [Bacterioplanes sanyensis]|uniref:Gonadoliberin III n=1 Tax=Bacterioplanes sanyensis TaxID=1249553 RepID=A0A222FL28_9GAMM|nr:inactive transglutaminase family protein [Bacterioplanes sanyensis]ASP39296.1 gonadoliberin III [Bacterioplanes sanyensis]